MKITGYYLSGSNFNEYQTLITFLPLLALSASSSKHHFKIAFRLFYLIDTHVCLIIYIILIGICVSIHVAYYTYIISSENTFLYANICILSI